MVSFQVDALSPPQITSKFHLCQFVFSTSFQVEFQYYHIQLFIEDIIIIPSMWSVTFVIIVIKAKQRLYLHNC